MNNLIVWPNRLLYTVSKPVESAERVQEILPNLLKIMAETKGMGISAIQIGIPEQLFAYQFEDKIGVVVNPVIELTDRSSKNKIEHGEGCLSFPGIYIKKTRWNKITLHNFSFELGKYFASDYEGIESLAIQHEFDHLNGVLLIDELGKVQRDIITRKLNKFMKKAKIRQAQISKITGKSPSALFKYKNEIDENFELKTTATELKNEDSEPESKVECP